MLLPLLLVFLVFIELQFRFSIFNFVQPVSIFFHEKCLAQVPSFSASHEILSALVCGENFKSQATAQLYASTGLIHLFVVSGSHLLLLQKIIQKFFSHSLIILICLLFYCAICMFNPPITRSLVYLLLGFALYRLHRRWPNDYILLIAGLISLVINPLWINSLSLQMSWLATLVLVISKTPLQRQILLYFLFQFCFLTLGFPEFSIILLCVIMTPVLEFILFPLALLTVAFHFFEPFFSNLMWCLNTFLQHLNYYSTRSPLLISDGKLYNWIVIFGLHFFLFSRKPKS